MIDREKVLKGLEICTSPVCRTDCPYDNERNGCSLMLMQDALELLKTQGPAKPRYDRGYMDYNCPVCGVYLLFHQKYCNECGRELDWNAE